MTQVVARISAVASLVVNKRRKHQKKKREGVYELLRDSVEAPIDGAEVERESVGFFSSAANARAYISDYRKGPWAVSQHEKLVVFRVREHRLDESRGDFRTIVYDASGKRIGAVAGFSNVKRWLGRRAEDCRFSLGEIVGLFHGGEYRVGIVLARPWEPTTPRKWSGLESIDDVYLVDLVTEGEPGDHAHLHDAHLFRHTNPVDPDLERALTERFRLHNTADGRDARELRSR